VRHDKEQVERVRKRKHADIDELGLLARYVNDIWMGEEPPPRMGDTTDLQEAIEEGDFERFTCELGLKPEDALFWWYMGRNFLQVSRWLFGGGESNEFNAKSLNGMLQSDFNFEFACKLHKEVCNGLVEQPGELRTCRRSPLGSSLAYAHPSAIRPWTEALFECTRYWIASCETVWQALQCATVFFSELLLIHPFHDGNGRTARLLLSHLLRHFTWVPISLYLSSAGSKQRSQYIEVLESRGYDESSVQPLFFYIVDCCRNTITAAFWSDPEPEEETVPSRNAICRICIPRA